VDESADGRIGEIGVGEDPGNQSGESLTPFVVVNDR